MKNQRSSANWLPVPALLLGATLWGVMWWPLRYFEHGGLQGPWLSLGIYGILTLLGLPLAWRARREWRGRGTSLAALMLFGGWTNVAFVLAMLEGEVVRVLLLFYLSPVWSVLGGRLVLGEALTVRRGLVVAVALFGAALLLGLDFRVLSAGVSRADWLALSSGMCFSFTNVTLRREQGLGGVNKSWAVWLGCLLIAGLLVVLGDYRAPAFSPSLSAQLLLFSAVWVGLSTFVVQYGVTRMEVGRSAVLLLFELVAGTLSAIWLTDEHLVLREWIGGLLIVSAAFLEARSAANSPCGERMP